MFAQHDPKIEALTDLFLDRKHIYNQTIYRVGRIVDSGLTHWDLNKMKKKSYIYIHIFMTEKVFILI